MIMPAESIFKKSKAFIGDRLLKVHPVIPVTITTPNYLTLFFRTIKYPAINTTTAIARLT